MTGSRQKARRPYAPDYVLVKTLAYRLDCSPSTVESYVRVGLLPGPEMIGNLPRWDFALVVAFIKARNDPGGQAENADEDECLKALRRGKTT